MRATLSVLVLVLAACGRVGFAPVDEDAGADAAAVDPGLLLWMRFDPAALFVDSISQRTATCTRCPIASGARAVSFERACLAVRDSPTYHRHELTVALWFRATGTTSGTAFGKPYENATRRSSFELAFATPTQLRFVTTDDSLPAPATSTGIWHHVAATFQADRKRLYIDGRLVAEELQPPGPLAYTDDALRIGCDSDGLLGRYFEGELADLRLYDRALTSAEVVSVAASDAR